MYQITEKKKNCRAGFSFMHGLLIGFWDVGVVLKIEDMNVSLQGRG